MGWADCGDDQWGRPMGYGIPAICDEKGCDEEIDRGLAYVCGGMHEGGEYGCGGYFCEKHRFWAPRRKGGDLCARCLRHSGSGVGHWIKHSRDLLEARPAAASREGTGGGSSEG